MITDFSCGAGPNGIWMAALALVVTMIDLLNSSGKLSDGEVTDMCRNAQELLPEVGADAEEARKALSGITQSRTVEP